MAKLIRVNSKNPRRKKWEHFKLRFRILLFRTSVLLNFLCILYFLETNGILTNYYRQVFPIMEALINKLPL